LELLRVMVVLDDSFLDALHCSKPVGGLTHGFYLYPARFPPEIARAVISTFSRPGECVLDPFMGGGTSIVEGLAQGQRMLGIDINALAHFVTTVRTTPLSPADEFTLQDWAQEMSALLEADASWVACPGIMNLPPTVEAYVAGMLDMSQHLPFPRQRAFARCALLRLSQWALDCKDYPAPRRTKLARQFPILVESLLTGLREFVTQCQMSGIPKHHITRYRTLLHQDTGSIDDAVLVALGERPHLVFTSPPYPGVHVLYHRWQCFGRKETPAPYWIANVPDGHGASFYTAGSRTRTGVRNYFTSIIAAFRAVRRIIAPDGLVVQLIGFADAPRQLPTYLSAMEAAGFVEAEPQKRRLTRRVANRKWYAKHKGATPASNEVLLFHRPA
jgi:DNA methylase